ncbi:unnamed protein product [Phytophthora fragariaefolia]|uniref:Unnamed protein product n=1 Tax=Phytophthora fragariaefolia TaxID=1490495 RepID=A0A9W7CW41_9STRA|nr:unnamed protein product [Phytophthora fragariaefolia]
MFANREPDESTLTPHGIRANPAKLAAIAELPFPTSKKGMQGFLGALNYYSRFIQNMAVYDAVLYQLKDADFADGGDLATAKLAFAELKTKVANAPILRHFDSAREVHIMLFANAWTLIAESPGSAAKNSATVHLDPELLYAHVPQNFVGHVLSFDGSAKTEKNGGYGSCSWILWSLPSWDIVIAASVQLPSPTVNIAEYTGMNNGVMAALDRGLTDLIIVGDSRPAIQQSMGVMACKKEALQLELARHKKRTGQLSSVRYLHILRHYNAAADSLATKALESKMGRVVLSGDRKADLKELNRVSELLYTSPASADSGEPRAEMTVMTRRQACRVHFENEAIKDSAGISQNTGLHVKETNSPNSRTEGLQFESPRAPKRVRRVEDQAEVEVSEGRIPDATDVDPAVVQAERRRPATTQLKVAIKGS